MKEPAINCAFDEMRDVVNLVKHPQNPNTHSEQQIELLAKIIQHQGWRNPVVVSERSGFIVAGHGRLMAAEKLGLKQVPVDLQSFDNEADELAHLVADNRIAELSETNRSTLADLITTLDTGDYDLTLTGFEKSSLEELMFAAPPEVDFPELREGDGDGFRTMTFIVSDEQHETISVSVREAQEMGDNGTNENSNGNGLHGLALLWARQKK